METLSGKQMHEPCPIKLSAHDQIAWDRYGQSWRVAHMIEDSDNEREDLLFVQPELSLPSSKRACNIDLVSTLLPLDQCRHGRPGVLQRICL